jgi:hypothetical protein
VGRDTVRTWVVLQVPTAASPAANVTTPSPTPQDDPGALSHGSLLYLAVLDHAKDGRALRSRCGAGPVTWRERPLSAWSAVGARGLTCYPHPAADR